jgi:hypothetical protein
MRVVIDTCSLVNLVRYYLPFDKDFVLFNFIKQKFARNEIIIVDKVLRECYGVSDKIVIKAFDFLMDKNFTKSAKIPYDTSTLVAPDPVYLFEKIDTSFADHEVIMRKKWTPTEYENQKQKFVNTADMTQIILCLRLIEDRVPITLVTEETPTRNDGKPFKKIPVICDELRIPRMSLPEYLEKSEGIELQFMKKGYSNELLNPICFSCKHITPLSGGCSAFPNGIPRTILQSNKHDKPIEGQKNNLVFSKGID